MQERGGRARPGGGHQEGPVHILDLQDLKERWLTKNEQMIISNSIDSPRNRVSHKFSLGITGAI